MKNVQEFLILAGQNDELKKRDAITVKSEDHVSGSRPAGGRASSPPTYLHVTLIENVWVADLYSEEEQQFRSRELEARLGTELTVGAV
jgi:hypothetical protein